MLTATICIALTISIAPAASPRAPVPPISFPLFTKTGIGIFEVQAIRVTKIEESFPHVFLRTYSAVMAVKESLPPGSEKKTFHVKFKQEVNEGSVRFKLGYSDPDSLYWMPVAKGGLFIATFDLKTGLDLSTALWLKSSPKPDTSCWIRPRREEQKEVKGKIEELAPAWNECKILYESFSGAEHKAVPARLAKVLDDRKPVGKTFFTVIQKYDRGVFDTEVFCSSVAAWLGDKKIDFALREEIAHEFLHGNDEIWFLGNFEPRDAKGEAKLLYAYAQLIDEAEKTNRNELVFPLLQAIHRGFLRHRKERKKTFPALDSTSRDILKKAVTRNLDLDGSADVLEWVSTLEKNP